MTGENRKFRTALSLLSMIPIASLMLMPAEVLVPPDMSCTRDSFLRR
jgi:hypothetical protein